LIDYYLTSSEQELLTLPEHLSSHPVFSGVRVTRSLVLYQFSFHNINTIIYSQFLYITKLAEKNKYSQTYLKGHLYNINYCL
jgi:hypothetical protein